MTPTTFNEAWTGNRIASTWSEPSPRFSSRGSRQREGQEARYREIIELFNGWLSDPTQLQAEDLSPPARGVTEYVVQACQVWLQKNHPLPDRVFPEAEGGLVLEWFREPTYIALELSADGRALWASYRDSSPAGRGSFLWKH